MKVKRCLYAIFCAAGCGEIRTDPELPFGGQGGKGGGTSTGANDAALCTMPCSPNHADASCVDGKCVLHCEPRYADCNQDPSDGCEANLDENVEHCGACGNACDSWGSCLGAICTRVVATVPGPSGLAISDSQIYWSGFDIYAGEFGQIGAANLDGSGARILATEPSPREVLCGNHGLFWVEATTKTIYRRSVDADNPEPIFTDTTLPHLLGADGEEVYFSVGPNVYSMPKAGGEPRFLAGEFIQVSAGQLANGDLYLADLGEGLLTQVDGVTLETFPQGRISRIRLSDLVREELVTFVERPTSILVRNGDLFWLSGGSLATYFVGDVATNVGNPGALFRGDLDGVGATQLASGLVNPGHLAADDAFVYWASQGTMGGSDPKNISYKSNGGVFRVPISGGTAELISPPIDARQLVLSGEDFVYASFFYGLVIKQAKPN